MWRLWKAGAWPVMGFASHQQMHGGPPGRNVECSHFSRQHYGDRSAPRRRHTRRRSEVAPKWAGQREHMVRQGLTGRCWSELLCLGCYLAPPRQVGGGLPRGMRSADTSPPTPAAGAPPAGPWQEPNWVYYAVTWCGCRSTMCHAFISRLAASNLHDPRSKSCFCSYSQ
jgi:hypothetical protein